MPLLSTVLINVNRVPSRLFVTGGLELASQEGTTQGCVFAMAMYAIGAMPLVNHLRSIPVTQAWYADDSQAAGNLPSLRRWWDAINEYGPPLGYFPKPSKTFLVIKPALFDRAKSIFEDTGVQLVDGGKRDLGAAIEDEKFIINFLEDKIKE